MAALLGLVLTLGCAGAGPGPSPPAAPRGEDLFLVSPLEGFPGRLPTSVESEIVASFSAMTREGGAELAGRTALRLLQEDPRRQPAAVLAAQADFVNGRLQEVKDRLLPVVEELPEYTAAQLLLGRAAERMQDIVTAFGAYRRAAPALPLAEERASYLRARALEIVSNRVEEGLARQRLDQAREALGLMREWDPGAEGTLDAARKVARAEGDEEGELEAVRLLARRRPGDLGVARRQGELEVRKGDAGRGIQILQQLASEHPGDEDLAQALAEAKFLWRVNLLPPEIGRLGQLPQLTRGDFAPLMFWLFPDIRHGRATSPRIANDVFESPHREEIVRVVNMGLLDVDPDLHRFYPERAITRTEVLSALFRLLASKRSELGCLGGAGRGQLQSREGLCEAAARCGILDAASECLPGAPISGPETLALARRAQELLGLD